MSKIVIMNATIEVTKPLYHKKYFIGGFNFIINNNEVPFDFNITKYNIDKNKENGNDIIYYESGRGNDGFNIADGYYSQNYKNIGLDEEDITAEFLSKVKKIKDFHFKPEDYVGIVIFEIKEILFFNRIGAKYKVKQEVINEYNKSHGNIRIRSENEFMNEDLLD